ncbi:hypothetical protein H2203_002851 [Taxawa tesnikishii (nom. ined.)]|nr:hypothetical protein H2203_002851 [Dothideales sp. JES 119]
MPLPQQTSINPTTEKPMTSETGGDQLYPKDSVPAADVSDQKSPVGVTGGKSEAELAAEKVYEERIEDEYAKREGGA